jgi:ubiquinone/menaquinone biosynthesis C-methylase UbiE
MRAKTNFNIIAPFYDGLCQLVFGQQVKNAQIEALTHVPANSTVLIAGGGTGWILDEISQIYPGGITITYVDISSKMIEISKKRNLSLNKVTFINDSIENVPLPEQRFNVIITPFFLDCFSQSSFQSIFKKLDSSLKINGLWLNIDFSSAKSSYWQKMLTKLMYAFFRFTCKIEATEIPSIEICFAQYNLLKEKMFCRDFINMQVFQKNA